MTDTVRYDDRTPRLFFLAAVVWAVVGMLVGVLIAVPVAAGILIICLVFLPLLSLQGLEGKLFAPVALTIVFALSGSLILSLTLIPVLSSYLLGAGSHREAWLMRIGRAHV